ATDNSLRCFSEIGSDDRYNSVVTKMAIPPMTVIGLMNCKNVKVEKSERRAVHPPRKRDKRIATLSYHTIVLPGSTSTPSGNGERTGVMPQHKVRGHFKTFTA